MSALSTRRTRRRSGLAYLNLTLAAAIPITWFVVRVVHGLRPGWLASVRPRIRWAYLVACLGVSVVALIATLLVSAVLPSQGGGHRDQRPAQRASPTPPVTS